MIDFALKRVHPGSIGALTAVTIIAAACLAFLSWGVTCNQVLAVLLSLLVITIWQYSKVNGLIAAMLFYMIKAFFLRVAFAIDFEVSGSGGADILGVTPALLLSVLICAQLYADISANRPLLADRTRVLLMIFCGLSFLSVFNPASSIIVGLGGIMRNILPNMMILFVAASLFTEQKHFMVFLRALLIVGLVSCAYAAGQYVLGLYPWELSWFREVAFKDGLSGWLTIGLRGVEFRPFSMFYGYMDFLFSNVLIFTWTLCVYSRLSGGWRKTAVIYIVLWIGVLMLSLERMPMLMTIVAGVIVLYYRVSPARRKAVVSTVAAITIAGILFLSVGGQALRATGADKLVRLAELANPFQATSIRDRLDNKWAPTLRAIRSNPLGVGIGNGSSSRADYAAAQTGYHVQPHNELLQKTLELGLPGGIVYVFLLASLFSAARRIRGRQDKMCNLEYAVIAGTVAFFMCGMVNVPFSGANGLLFWAMSGAVVGNSVIEPGRVVKNERQKSLIAPQEQEEVVAE